MAGEKEYPALLAVKCGQEAFDDLVANAKTIGSTKEVIVRELVRAFNEFCSDGRRAVLPLAITSLGYRIEGGRVVDASSEAAKSWALNEAADAAAAKEQARRRGAKPGTSRGTHRSGG